MSFYKKGYTLNDTVVLQLCDITFVKYNDRQRPFKALMFNELMNIT